MWDSGSHQHPPHGGPGYPPPQPQQPHHQPQPHSIGYPVHYTPYTPTATHSYTPTPYQSHPPHPPHPHPPHSPPPPAYGATGQSVNYDYGHHHHAAPHHPNDGLGTPLLAGHYPEAQHNNANGAWRNSATSPITNTPTTTTSSNQSNPPGKDEAPPAYAEHATNHSSYHAGAEARYEHERRVLPLWCSLADIELEYGRTIYMYFLFERFMLLINIILAVVQFGWYIPAWVDQEHKAKLSSGLTRSSFFINHLPDTFKVPWYICNALCLLINFLSAPAYNLYARRAQSRHMEQLEREGKTLTYAQLLEDDTIVRVDKNGNILSDARYRTKTQRWIRRGAAYFVFFLLLGVLAGLTLLLTHFKNTNNGRNRNINLAIALVSCTMNLFFTKMADILTSLEEHKKWSTHRKHKTIKKVAFKLCNIMVVYLFRHYSPDYCGSDELADQFFWLLVVDIFVMNAVELLLPPFMAYLRRKRAAKTGSRASDEELRPQFDVADEYVEVIVRQLVIIMASAVFPAASLFGVLGTLIEYGVDKFKLMRMCARPPRETRSMRVMFTAAMLVIATMACLMPNAGVILVMGKWSYAFTDSASGNCVFP